VTASTEAWAAHARRLADAAAVLDHLHGDASTYYFHSQARLPHPASFLTALHRPGRAPGAPLDTADLATRRGVTTALGFAVQHFSSDSPTGLFRDRCGLHAQASAARATLLAALPRALPPDLAGEAEGPDGDGLLAEEDLAWALSHAQRGTSAGYDGLPYEFYRAHKQALLPVLRRVFNTAFAAAADPQPLAALLTSVICLIPKPGKPADELENLRPITLLNCDAKLVMLIMSNRLQRPLEFLIDITQSAFLVGRDISDNVRYHLALSARLEELGLPGWLLISDLAKAYDSVNRGYLRGCMTAMGFRPEGIVRWVDILLNGSTSCVRLNGFLSRPFPVRHSLAQGSSASCQQWAIVLQPFISYLESLRAQGHLSSVPLPSGAPAPASLQFADDVKHLATHPDSDLPCIRDAYGILQAASGIGQSVPKCRLSHLAGPVPPPMDPALSPAQPPVHAATGYQLLPEDAPPPRLLGVPFSRNHSACVQAAFNTAAGSMRAAASKWAPLQLGLLGRAHVAVACIASKLVYLSIFMRPPATQLKAMQQVVDGFLAATSRPEEEAPFPTRQYPWAVVASLPADAGGVGRPVLSHQFAAMRAKAVWQSFCYTQHPWAQLFRHQAAKALPASAPATFPPGHHCLVLGKALAGAHLDLRALPTPFVRDAVEAFLGLDVRRVSEPHDLQEPAVLLELTFHNDCFTAPSVSSPEASTWLRLRDVRAAHAARERLSAAATADLDAIVAVLPSPWAAVVQAHGPLRSAWHVVSAPDDPTVVLQGPAPGADGGNDGNGGGDGAPRPLLLWGLLPTGRLAPLWEAHIARDPASHPPRPALVVSKPKPRWAYTRAEIQELEAAKSGPRPPGARPYRPPEEPFLAGIWEDMALDPTAWGVVTVSLLNMTVRTARLHLAAKAAATAGIPGYQQQQAAFPKAWQRRPAPAPSPPSPGPSPAAAPPLGGLAAEEQRWAASAAPSARPPRQPGSGNDSSDGADLPGQSQGPPAWLDLTRRPSPRAPPLQRATDRRVDDPAPLPGAAEGDLPDGFELTWQRLADPTLSRPHRLTCWRMLHLCLGCNAYLHHVRRNHAAGSITSPLCQAPGCLTQGSIETLSHAFLECPMAQPVISWLLDTWEALSGSRPPHTAALLLADDPAEWPEAEADPQGYQLWTRLRVATLGAIWSLRCQRSAEGEGSFARRAVSLAISTVVSAIERDWRRSQSDVRQLDNGDFSRDWWRAVDASIDIGAFATRWATPAFLCDVVGDKPARRGDRDDRQLVLRLSLAGPCPLPA
jgi:hypothetical protein